MTQEEKSAWYYIQEHGSHSMKIDWLFSLVKPGKNYFISTMYRSELALMEFENIVEINPNRYYIRFSKIDNTTFDIPSTVIGCNFTADYEYVIWNGKTYRGHFENSMMTDTYDFDRLSMDFEMYRTAKAIEEL